MMIYAMSKMYYAPENDESKNDSNVDNAIV